VNPGRFRLPFTRAKNAPRERGSRASLAADVEFKGADA
jgi:hypothetical protein